MFQGEPVDLVINNENGGGFRVSEMGDEDLKTLIRLIKNYFVRPANNRLAVLKLVMAKPGRWPNDGTPRRAKESGMRLRGRFLSNGIVFLERVMAVKEVDNLGQLIEEMQNFSLSF